MAASCLDMEQLQREGLVVDSALLRIGTSPVLAEGTFVCMARRAELLAQ